MSLKGNEKYLKRILKGKISMNRAILITFMISGFIGISKVVLGEEKSLFERKSDSELVTIGEMKEYLKNSNYLVYTDLKGIGFKGDYGEISTKLGEEVKITGGVKEATNLTDNNIGVIMDNGELKVKLSQKLDGLKEIKVGDIRINGGEKENIIEGLGNTSLDGYWGTGSRTNQAATEGQLRELSNKIQTGITNVGVRLKGDDDDEIKKSLNDTVTIKGGKTNKGELSDNNIGVLKENDSLKIKLSKKLSGIEEIKLGEKTIVSSEGIKINSKSQYSTRAGEYVKLTETGLDNGGNKILNVFAGEISANSQDAINGSQLMNYYTKNEINGMINNGVGEGNLTTSANLNYGANGKSESISLSQGLDFQNGIYTNASIESGGKVKIDINKDRIVDLIKENSVIHDGKDIIFQGDENIKVNTEGVDTKVSLNSNLQNIDSISNGKSKIELFNSKISISSEMVDFNGGKVTGIKNGEISANSQDAINGSQLYETNLAVENIANGVNQNTNRIKHLDNEISHVGSLSAALAGLHTLQYDPFNPSQVMAAVGNYKNKSAVAVGLAHYVNEKFMVSGAISVGEETRLKSMMSLGFAYKFGDKEARERREIPKEYNVKQIATIHFMQDEIYKEKIKNQNQNREIEDLKVRLERMEKLLNSRKI